MVRGWKGLQGLFILGNESSREQTVPGMKVPGKEWSQEQKFHHGNRCSRERIVLRTNAPPFERFGNFLLPVFSFLGAKVPTGNLQFQERKFSLGIFTPGSESSRELLFKGANVPWNTHSAERYTGTWECKSNYKLHKMQLHKLTLKPIY